jgi:hypothetical protein
MGLKHNTGSGDWRVATTWDPAGVPSSEFSDVLLDFGGPATVALSGAGGARTVVIANLNTLALSNATLSTGRINVTNGGVLFSQDGANTIGSLVNQGGTVTVAAGTRLHAYTYNTDWSGGSLGIGDNATLELGFGNIKNVGEIALSSIGGATQLVAGGGLTLTTELNAQSPDYAYSGGRLVLSDSAGNLIGTLAAGSVNATLTNVSNTIAGAGRIGAGKMSIVNQAAVGTGEGNPKTGEHSQGVIQATGVNHALEIELGSNNKLTNGGLIEAAGAGGLSIFTTVGAAAAAKLQNTGLIQVDAGSRADFSRVDIDNTTGTISAFGGNLDLADVRISNGKVTVEKPAAMAVRGTTVVTDAILNVVGGLTVDATANLTLNRGTLDLTGVASVIGKLSVADSNLTVQSSAVLAVLGSVSTNKIMEIKGRLRGDGTVAATSLTNSESGTVAGTVSPLTLNVANQIENRGNMTLVDIKATTLSNSGTIAEATFRDGTRIVNQATGTIGNSAFGLLDVSGGTVVAIEGEHVSFAGTNYDGGTLGSRDGGVIDVKAANRDSKLTDVAIESGSTFAVANGATLEIHSDRSTAVTLDKVSIGVGGGALSTTLAFTASHSDLPFVLQGGSVDLTNSPLNRLLVDAGFVNASSTISGAGLISESRSDAALDLDNRLGGVVAANASSGLTIKLDDITNDGTFVADGSTLKVVTPNDIGGGGFMQVMNGGTLDLSDAKSFFGSFSYAGRGTILGPDVAPAGTIEGFASGDTYVFGKPASIAGPLTTLWTPNAQNTGGTLAIKFGASQTYATLQLSGTYTSTDFSATAVRLSDGSHVAVNFTGAMRWTKPLDGSWQTASNWSPTGLSAPGSEDDALITVAGGPYTVTSSGQQTVRSVATGASATLLIQDGRFVAGGSRSDLGLNEGLVKVAPAASLVLTGLFGQVDGGAIEIGNRRAGLQLAEGGSVRGGRIAIGTGSSLTASGGRAKNDLDELELVNGGDIDVDYKSSLVLGNVTLTGAGQVSIDSRATLVLGSSTLTGNIVDIIDGADLIVSNYATLDGYVRMVTGSEIKGLEGGLSNLTNVGVIRGGGRLGNDALALINSGSILTGFGSTMILDTGPNTIVNDGTILARVPESGFEGIIVRSALDNRLQLGALGGNMFVNGQLTNSGVVSSRGAGSYIQLSGNVVNSGKLWAADEGALTLRGTVTQQAGAQLLGTGPGATVSLEGGSVTGGLLRLRSGGQIHVTRGVNAIADALVDVDSGGSIIVTASLSLIDTIVSSDGDGGVFGRGNLTLVDSSLAGGDYLVRDDARVRIGGSSRLSADAVRLRDGGQVVSNGQTATLINGGYILGEGTGGVLGDSNLSLVNDGILTTGFGGSLAIRTGGNAIVNDGQITTSDANSRIDISSLLKLGETGVLRSDAGSIRTDRVENAGAIVVTGSGEIEVQGGLLNSGRVVARGGSTLVSLATNNSGAITTVDASTKVTLGDDLNVVTNSGQIMAKSASTIVFEDGVNNVSGGRLMVDLGGFMEIGGAAAGGLATIRGDGSVMNLQGSSVALTTTNAVFGAGSSRLMLDNSARYAGLVSGFSGGDTIEVEDIAFVAGKDFYDASTNQLSLSDGIHSTRLQLLGQYAANAFAFASNGHGGTLVSIVNSEETAGLAPNLG